MDRKPEQVALVTGGSAGIGAATAAALAARGMRVFCAQRGSSAHEDIAADLADPEAPGRVMAAIADRAGRLDVLVNNAGVMREGRADTLPLDDWHRQIQVNLTAPFLLVRHGLALLRRAARDGGAAIVNVGSIEGLGSNPGHAAYGAAKAGLHGLTRALAVDHGAEGLRCNAVAPGWIDTALNVDYVAGMADPAGFRDRIGGIHPVRRTGRPEDIAEVICFLASPEASFITGQVFTIDGGRMAQLSLP